MLFNRKVGLGDFEIIKEGSLDIMRINYDDFSYYPSIEDNSVCMADVVDKLSMVPSVSRIILYQKRNYEYDYDQTLMLREIANIYNHLTRQKKILSSVSFLGGGVENSSLFVVVQNVVTDLLKSDPVGAYVELRRLIREEKVILSKIDSDAQVLRRKAFLDLLLYVYNLLDKTILIKKVKRYLAGHRVGDRGVYKNIFSPTITPDFMFIRLMASVPSDAREIDSYSLLGGSQIGIYSVPNDVKYLYHLNPPEFNISEDKYALIELARGVLSEHKPKSEDFINPERIRNTFFNIGRDLLIELCEHKNISFSYKEIEEMADILVRYTVGFGLIEILLSDEKIQDISINGPIGEMPIFIVHQDFDECVTNIIPTREDGLSWATKFRILSGRPLDEANPVLDTELIIPGARSRVAVVSNPLNPYGVSYSFRRHRDRPWTFPLFIQNGMIEPLASGLLSFLIDGSRSILVAGTRSSGKTSFLASILVEIMRKYRLITLEDTLELPVDSLRKFGYNIQPLKVRAALAIAGGTEVAADEGIRTSLRMGDSSLIVGEIRSKEALALFEAMRVGALANVVAGTIHGDSPYGVFDRVVNDLGVPRTSFKATDIIIVANPIKTADGLHKKRRIISITEVRKDWENDPLKEGGFVDLMVYNTKTDKLEPTDYLINGDSEIIKAVASNTKEWAGNWDAVWDNIVLRAKIKEQLVSYANVLKMPRLLEADFCVLSNDTYHKISDVVRVKKGFLDSKAIFYEWDEWIKKEIRKRKQDY